MNPTKSDWKTIVHKSPLKIQARLLYTYPKHDGEKTVTIIKQHLPTQTNRADPCMAIVKTSSSIERTPNNADQGMSIIRTPISTEPIPINPTSHERSSHRGSVEMRELCDRRADDTESVVTHSMGSTHAHVGGAIMIANMVIVITIGAIVIAVINVLTEIMTDHASVIAAVFAVTKVLSAVIDVALSAPVLAVIPHLVVISSVIAICWWNPLMGPIIVCTCSSLSMLFIMSARSSRTY